jgi:hypothetical protein
MGLKGFWVLSLGPFNLLLAVKITVMTADTLFLAYIG